MYSLLVSHLAEKKTDGEFEIERDRFLEYTDDKTSVPLEELANEAIDSLRSWPCLLMNEGRTQEVARVVKIRQIVAGKRNITVRAEDLKRPIEITNNELWKLRTDLDIADFEFSRNHWAVKERDLFSVLKAAGHTIKSSHREKFELLPLPAVPRSALLQTCSPIAALGHSGIDDLLLEAGIPGLKAGRDLGNAKLRARAIVQFALGNQGAVTAENSLLPHFLLRAADLPEASAPSAHALPKASSVKFAAASGHKGRSPNRVFVVHGRNDEARDGMVAFLDSVGLKGVVLHDQPSMGQHLLTKFIGQAKLATFAVVLMTDDDQGRAKNGKLAPRARQNVILELGYFLAHLGQARICALISPGLETPSDFDGIVYIRMSSDGRWKKELLRELRAAKMPVVREG